MAEIYLNKLNKGISVDCVIFGFDLERLNVLLIQREPLNQDDLSDLALPGDLIYNDENFNNASNRVLKELTGLENIFLEQVGAFGDINRLSKPHDRAWLQSVRDQPNVRVITVAYYSLVNQNSFHPTPSKFAKSIIWKPVNEIESLAFDHLDILQAALQKLKNKLQTHPIGFNLLPEKFTLSELHKLYEAIIGKELDKRNFRRKMLKLELVTKLNEKQSGVAHKPSNYYSFNLDKYEKLQEEGYNNFGF